MSMIENILNTSTYYVWLAHVVCKTRWVCPVNKTFKKDERKNFVFH